MANELTHFDAAGNAHMVDVSEKKETERIGVARGKFVVPDDFQRWDEEVVDLFETS